MKVADIRPEAALAGQQAALLADIDWLAARRAEFVAVDCPACGAADVEPLFEKYAMRHGHCRGCGTQFVSPRPTAAMLGAFYAQSANYRYWAKHIFPPSREARRRQIFAPRAAMVERIARARAAANETLVEVGAAHGVFCEEVRKLGLFSRIVAIEPTPDLAASCRELGFETIEAPFEQVSLAGLADMVASFEVIEHLFDPGAFLRWCRALLKPGGFLLLTCPNIAGFETTLLGRESSTVDHEHLNLFTLESLALLAERCGFVAIEAETPGELDVELVRHALDAGGVRRESIDPLVLKLIERGTDGALQKALVSAKLSSNMRVLAQRPA